MSASGNKFEFHFQGKILGLLLGDFNFLEKYGAIILPEYFSDVNHQILCEIVNKYWQKYNHAPSLEIVIEEIEKFEEKEKRSELAETLEEVLEEEVEDDSEYYQDEVVAFCRRQATILALKEAAGKLKDGELDAVVPTIERAMMVGCAFDAKSMGLSYWDHFDKPEIYDPTPRIPTLLGEVGSTGLDDVLKGGLQNGNLGMIMMPTGRGKSVFLLNIAGNAVFQGYNTAVVSFENSEKLTAIRFNQFFTGLTSDIVEKMPGAEVRAQIQKTFGGMKLGQLQVKEFPMKSATVREVEAYFKSLQSRSGWFPDVVIVDYLDIIKAPYPKKDTWEKLKEIAEELKAMAQRIKRPVWTASQVNRGGAKKQRIDNEDVAGSFSKIDAFDFVLTAAPQVDEETDERTARMFCSKNRQGKDQMTLDFELDLDVMRFVFRPRTEQNSNASVAFRKFRESRRGS